MAGLSVLIVDDDPINRDLLAQQLEGIADAARTAEDGKAALGELQPDFPGSFHYQQDIWRVNQVRQSWRYRHEDEREAEGFYDGSIWESSTKE